MFSRQPLLILPTKALYPKPRDRARIPMPAGRFCVQFPTSALVGTVTFEIDKTNYALSSSTTLKIGVDGASTATDADFAQGLHASIMAALNDDVIYDPRTGTLTFGPKTVFPFTFTMTAANRRRQ